MCVCVSLLGKLVMCCRYSCQNGHAILAQVFPVLNDLWRNLLCLSFAIMTAMEATSPLASESATLDSISLADAASSTGEDFSHAWHSQTAGWASSSLGVSSMRKSSPVDEAATTNEVESKVADSDAKGLVASIVVMMARALPRAPCGHWWRWQDTYHLRWQLGPRQLPYPTKHGGKDRPQSWIVSKPFTGWTRPKRAPPLR